MLRYNVSVIKSRNELLRSWNFHTGCVQTFKSDWILHQHQCRGTYGVCLPVLERGLPQQCGEIVNKPLIASEYRLLDLRKQNDTNIEVFS